MKKIALAAALALAGTQAFAGGLAPTNETTVIVPVEQPRGSSASGLIIPLIVVALLLLATQGGDDSGEDSPPT